MNGLMYDSYTIFWRELKRYKKSRSGVLIRLIQPAIWIIVIGNTFSGTQPLIQSEAEYPKRYYLLQLSILQVELI